MSIVEFSQVSKRLRLEQHRSQTFREALIGLTRCRGENTSERGFWALRDLSFSIHDAETVGIVGPNGAGKSSLLKLIARIYEPTSGRVRVEGRVSALLELGTGFHPDLTGRENIYLSAAIMGLDRATIQRSLESIVDFSGLERFIDAPVKHYSSGMYMRLGFSVAIHVEPNILLIDEVLSVGDQQFQARCLERISSLQAQGITIVFVSHDLGAVRRICRRCIWLENGTIMDDGDAEKTLGGYLRSVWTIDQMTGGDEQQAGKRWGSREATLQRVEFLYNNVDRTDSFCTGDRFVARLWYESTHRISRPSFGVAIHRDDGTHITGPNTTVTQFDLPYIDGRGYIDYIVEAIPLLPGRYEFTATIYDRFAVHPYDHRHRQFAFRVLPGGSAETEGVVTIPCRWSHTALGD